MTSTHEISAAQRGNRCLGDPSAEEDLFAQFTWYVVQTQPRKEAWALQHLDHQGFATFFPRFVRQQIRRSQFVRTLDPVFPGYVFVAFDRDRQPWTAIRSTRGVRRLIGPNSGAPQAVPAAAMSMLFERCRGGIMVNQLDDMKPGDQVRINTGPLAQRIAQVQSFSPDGRVSVLFDMLGCSNQVEVELGALSPVF